MYLFMFLTLYMFRALRADHQERQIVSIQPVVAVGGRVVCRSEVGRIILGLTVWYVGAYAPAILIWEDNIRIDCLVCRGICSCNSNLGG